MSTTLAYVLVDFTSASGLYVSALRVVDTPLGNLFPSDHLLMPYGEIEGIAPGDTVVFESESQKKCGCREIGYR